MLPSLSVRLSRFRDMYMSLSRSASLSHDIESYIQRYRALCHYLYRCLSLYIAMRLHRYVFILLLPTIVIIAFFASIVIIILLRLLCLLLFTATLFALGRIIVFDHFLGICLFILLLVWLVFFVFLSISICLFASFNLMRRLVLSILTLCIVVLAYPFIFICLLLSLVFARSLPRSFSRYLDIYLRSHTDIALDPRGPADMDVDDGAGGGGGGRGRLGVGHVARNWRISLQPRRGNSARWTTPSVALVQLAYGPDPQRGLGVPEPAVALCTDSAQAVREMASFARCGHSWHEF